MSIIGIIVIRPCITHYWVWSIKYCEKTESYDSALDNKLTRRRGQRSKTRNAKEPLWVRIHDRITADITVGVDAACEADGIGLQVTAGGRVIVAEVVVVKAGLSLQPLARKAVVIGGGADKAVLLAKGQGARVPDDLSNIA